MKIALDYDGTITKDVGFWDAFISLAGSHGHEVVIVTKRFDSDEERIELFPNIKKIYTSHEAKIFHVKNEGIDIWIDNNPFDIVGYPT